MAQRNKTYHIHLGFLWEVLMCRILSAAFLKKMFSFFVFVNEAVKVMETDTDIIQMSLHRCISMGSIISQHMRISVWPEITISACRITFMRANIIHQTPAPHVLHTLHGAFHHSAYDSY